MSSVYSDNVRGRKRNDVTNEIVAFSTGLSSFLSYLSLRHFISTSHVSVKYRLALSQVVLTINDPRPRYVKIVTIYSSPRPVSDVQILKADDYLDKWQPCATLTLARGASRAVATLPIPVVASNLKIEFSEFYERPGGSRASDGSKLLIIACNERYQNSSPTFIWFL